MAITQTFYVDPAQADGGDGSFATPYNRLDLAVTAATAAEARIRVRRGRVYTPYGTKLAVLDLSNKRPTGLLIVDDYGDEEGPPVLFGGTYMAPASGGWESRGGGVWRKPMAANAGGADPDAFRLYLGSAITGAAVNQSAGTGYTFGVAAARCNVDKTADEATILASLNSIARPDTLNRRLWMYTQKSDGTNFDGYLYVYTGSDALDPPSYYGGLTLVGRNGLTDASGFGRIYGIWLYNAQRVTVRGLRSVASPYGIRISAAAYATTDCVVERCESMAYGNSGLMIDGTAANNASRNVARDCKVDAVATLAEDWNWRDKGGISWIPGTQDACVIGKYTDACAFERVVSIDGNHDNFYIGAISGAGSTANARLTDCVSRSPGRDYGPCISSGGMGAGNVARIDRFHGSDNISWIHKTGDGKLLISDSYFGECKRPYPAYDQTTGGGGQDGLGVNLTPGLDVFANTSSGTVEAGAITAERCSFVNPYGWMIQIIGTYNATPGLVPTGAVQISNSLLADLKYIDNPAARTYNPGVLDRAGGSICCRDGGGVAGIIQFAHTTYWTGAAGQPRVAEATNPVPPLVTMEATAYITGSFSEDDPVVDAIGRPIAGSTLLGQAATNGLTRDAAGVYRNTASASGAYEYITARPTRPLPTT